MKQLLFLLPFFFFPLRASADIMAALSQGSAKLWGGGGCSSANSEKSNAAVQNAKQCLLASNGISTQAQSLKKVGDQAIADSEDGFFASLALQHSKELTCSSDFAKQVSTSATEARADIANKLKVLREAKQRLVKASTELARNPEATPKICPLNSDDLVPNPNVVAISGHDIGYELCKEILISRSAFESVYHSIPLSGVPEVRELLEKYANLSEGPELDTLNKSMDARISSAYADAAGTLKKSSLDLQKQGKGSGADIDRSTRYALLSDPLVVSHVIDSAGAGNKEIMNGIACRADQRFGSGSDALDRTVMVGSLLISGGSGLLLRAGAVAARVAVGANEIRMAGLLSVNAARALEYSAMGLSAGMDSVAAYSQIDKSCASQTPKSLSHGTNSSQQCVAAPTVQQLGQDSCVLAVSLSAIGFTTALGPTLLKGGKLASAETKALSAGKNIDPAIGATLNKESRISTASDILGRPLSQEQQKAILDAHDVGAGQIGKDGSPAAINNYTQAQLREKAVKLKAAGFNDTEIRQLMENGIVGNPRLPSALDPALVSDPRQKSFREALFKGNLDSLPEEQKVLSVPMADGRYAYKLVRTNSDGSMLVEDVYGKQMTLHVDQLGGVRFASDTTSSDFYKMRRADLQKALEQTPPASDRVTDFRKSWSSGDLTSRKGEASVISFKPDTEAGNYAAQVSKVYPDGRVEVTLYDGTKKILSTKELASAKFSSADTAKAYLQAAGTMRAEQATANSRVTSLFQQQRGLTVDPHDQYISGRSYVGSDGKPVRFQVRSSPEFRDAAVSSGQIKEFSQGDTAKLSPGSYSYLITRDGKLVTGKVEDNFELGVKHQNLGNGREVVSAGELKVLPDGTYQFNLESGTFTKSIVNDLGVSQNDLAKKTDSALQSFFSSRGQYSSDILLPQTNPSLETIRRACSTSEFLMVNLAACCSTVRLGCH